MPKHHKLPIRHNVGQMKLRIAQIFFAHEKSCLVLCADNVKIELNKVISKLVAMIKRHYLNIDLLILVFLQLCTKHNTYPAFAT